MLLRDQFRDLYSEDALPVLEELFKTAYELHPSLREKLFKTVQTDRDIWQSTEIHDMPLHSVVPEGTDYSYSRPNQGASKTIKPVKYGLGFSITMEAVEDGKFDMIAEAIRMMGESARESREIDAMNIFNNGFSSVTTADGVSLFNSAHTLPSGGTFSNVLTTAADLSVSSLETMLIDFEKNFVGDSGIKKMIRPECLLVPTDLKRYAREIVGSSLKADTAENNLNSFDQDALRVDSSVHLTDTDAWFLVANPSKNGLRIVDRTGIQTIAAGPDAGFDNDSMKYKSRYREKIDAIHAFGIFGTAGAS